MLVDKIKRVQKVGWALPFPGRVAQGITWSERPCVLPGRRLVTLLTSMRGNDCRCLGCCGLNTQLSVWHRRENSWSRCRYWPLQPPARRSLGFSGCIPLHCFSLQFFAIGHSRGSSCRCSCVYPRFHFLSDAFPHVINSS